ncbi:MAG: CPBP family intramembrane metalloprotease [Candidatus Eisenbacteria bacterium]|uniref:CPBP family intramembrane metalloprotease n=1 Tax=Eiseniibacteriota bacterium TaxID=2212470 RepID=A0A849SX85_UNCEI|nr:CPBP family intramembrane metalloprotease [Candidatus Eisenbacteria bacterium]
MSSSSADLPPDSLVTRAWARIPAVVRAVLVGFIVLGIGGSVSGVLMFANLRLAPRLPLFLPLTAVWLWLFWRFANGAGWPRRTSAARRGSLRARALPARVWAWALIAGGLALIAVMGIAFVTYRFATLPGAAYRAPFDVAAFPPWTMASIFVAVALTAGVVEEAAFRGYMLSGIQRRHGWFVGIGLVTILFYLAHLSHAYATIAFVPFFLAHGLVFGLLVRYTGSIVPGVVLHALSDLVVLPMQYGVVPSAGQWEFVSHGWMTLAAAVAAVPAFRRLARAASAIGSEP